MSASVKAGRAGQLGATRAPIPVPEPNLTPEEMIARAVALRPKLRAQQDENDERGTYSVELHRDFIKAGFYRCTQPRMPRHARRCFFHRASTRPRRNAQAGFVHRRHRARVSISNTPGSTHCTRSR
jgi:hypothetical protein